MTTERDKQREQYLRQLYELVDGDTYGRVHMNDVAGPLDFDQKTSERVAQWLYEHGLLDFPVLGGFVAITTEGADQVEAIEEAEAAEASNPAALTLTATELGQAERVVRDLRALVEDESIDMTADDRADLLAQVQTIEAQLRSPQPRRAVVRWALAAVKWTADHAGGALVGAGAVTAATALLHALS